MAMIAFQGKDRGMKRAAFVLEELEDAIGRDAATVIEGFDWIGEIAFCDGPPATRTLVMEMNVGALLTRGTSAHTKNGDVQVKAGFAIANLAFYGDDEVRERMVRDGVGRAVVLAMRRCDDNEFVQACGCGAIHHLLRFSGNIRELTAIPGIRRVVRSAARLFPKAEYLDSDMDDITLKDACPLILKRLDEDAPAPAPLRLCTCETPSVPSAPPEAPPAASAPSAPLVRPHLLAAANFILGFFGAAKERELLKESASALVSFLRAVPSQVEPVKRDERFRTGFHRALAEYPAHSSVVNEIKDLAKITGIPMP